MYIMLKEDALNLDYNAHAMSLIEIIIYKDTSIKKTNIQTAQVS